MTEKGGGKERKLKGGPATTYQGERWREETKTTALANGGRNKKI
jgi:hypothetical protein